MHLTPFDHHLDAFSNDNWGMGRHSCGGMTRDDNGEDAVLGKASLHRWEVERGKAEEPSKGEQRID